MKRFIRLLLVIVAALGIFIFADKLGMGWGNDGEANYNGVILLVVALIAACVSIVWKKEKGRTKQI